jgi:hypothetical protein
MKFANLRSAFERLIAFLRDPAWTGVGCFVTAFFGLLTLGVGTAVVAFTLGVFRRIQDVGLWLLQPWATPRYVVIVGSFVILALIVSVARQFFGLRSKPSAAPRSKSANAIRNTFLPVALTPGIGNAHLSSRYISPPTGRIRLSGIEFDLSENALIFDTAAHIREYRQVDGTGKRVELGISKPLSGIVAAHVLLNSGNSKNVYSRVGIGQISFYFRDAPPINVNLVLGYNIREWCPGNSGDYIREADPRSGLKQVWAGLSKDGTNAVIDCLTIPVFEIMRNAYLEKIAFVHNLEIKPPDTAGVNYSVFGISLEIAPSG